MKHLAKKTKLIKKNSIVVSLLSVLLLITASCYEPGIPEGNDADFTHFEFIYMLDTPVINKEYKTIYAQIDSIADITTLSPAFVLTHGATAYIENIVQKSGVSENNFSTIVEYKIVSENRNTVNYWKIYIYQVDIPRETDTGYYRNTRIFPGTYKINGNITIGDNVYFDVSPGVNFIMGPNSKFVVGRGARFIANGTLNNPITFTTEEGNTWDGFIFNGIDEADFHFCRFENGGQQGSQFMQINNSVVGVMNSEFENINCTGFLLDNTSTFRVFDNNTLTNVATNDGYPIIFNSINGVSNLGNNNKINTSKGILIKDGTIRSNVTLTGQTCPYIVENDITSAVSDITFFIRSGVKILMNSNKGIYVGNTKMVFKAEGTETNPVIFRGNEDIAGYWQGIHIGGNILAGSNITHCHILYAGNGNNTGAIKCDKTDESKITIQNCKINNTNSHGIYFTLNSKAKLVDTEDKIYVLPPFLPIFYEK